MNITLLILIASPFMVVVIPAALVMAFALWADYSERHEEESLND